MNLLFIAMLSALPKLNSRPMTYEDFEKAARRERVRVTLCNYSPEINGYYCVQRKGSRRIPHIVINSRLDDLRRTFTGFHELAHHFLHVPVSAQHWYYCRRTAKVTDRKQECEANAVALMAIIPKKLMLELYEDGIDHVDPDLAELCRQRWEVYQQYGV